MIEVDNNQSIEETEKKNEKKSDFPCQGRILLLTSSLLVDRVFLHTNLLPVLKQRYDVLVWATSLKNARYSSLWKKTGVQAEPFPEIRRFKEIPHNYLRRLNEFAWDFRFQPPSRISMMKHIKDKTQRTSVKALKIPAYLLAKLHLEEQAENLLEKFLLTYPRSDEAAGRLGKDRPDVVITTGPFQFEQPAVYTEAKKLGIPTLAYIPSWDNVSTKNRMVYKYDGYIVWSEQIKKELHQLYPASRNVPIYVCGAPQFDIFFQQKFYNTREEFCLTQGLQPNLPIILYAVGSPNFLQEHHGAIELARRVVRGDLGEVQMLVRPHPIHDNAEMKAIFDQFAPRVKLQRSPSMDRDLTKRSQDESQISEWVNTFRHSDVIVNLSSTVTIDAAIFDKPVVNLDFDPQSGQKQQELIKEINHLWTHFKPIAESGGVWLVSDFDELEQAIKEYLKNPQLHRKERRWIAEHVCGYLDGKCSERIGKAVMEFIGNR